MYLGIDLGGTDVKAVVLGNDGRIVWRRRVDTGAREGREAVLKRLETVVGSALADVVPLGVQAVGVAVPAVLDMPSGVLEHLPNFTPEWSGFPLKAELQVRLALPVCVLNDVRGATVAEQAWGAGRQYRHFICIAIGTGIGGGLVLNGQLYLGSRGAAGEIGHQTVAPDGPACNCGNQGCLEALASGPAIAREAERAIAAGDRELAALAGSIKPSPEAIARAAAQGSDSARRIYARAGEFIGFALANIVCVLNPEAIVVGGGIAEAGDLLLQPLRREIERRTVVFSHERGGVDVVRSPLGGQAGAMGAAAWAMQHGLPDTSHD